MPLCSASAASSRLSSRHKLAVVSRDIHKRLFLKIKQSFMDEN